MENRLGFTSILHAVKKLCVLNACFLAFMTIFRVFFFFYFAKLGELGAFGRYVLPSFFLGMRFDLSILAYLNSLVTLSLIFVWSWGRKNLFTAWVKALRYYYTAAYSIVIAVMAVDFGFFSYFKDHINVLIFGFIKDDTRALIKVIVEDHRFAAAAVGLVALIIVVDLAVRRTTRSILSDHGERAWNGKPWMKLGFALVLVCVNAAAARGSLGMFPLNPAYAEISPDPFINKLSVNGVSALAETVGFGLDNRRNDFDMAKRYGYDTEIARAFADFLGVPAGRVNASNLMANLRRRTPDNPAAARLRPNVVVVIMESMGTNLLRYDSPRFDMLGKLRPHFRSDHVFHNFLPAGLVSIHAIESIVLNLPQRPFDLSVTQSPAAYSLFPTAVTIPYKKAGYETVCLYGGSLGWRGLDSFLLAQGFDRVLGEGSLPGAEKNQWGVYDQHLFDEAYACLADGGKPKLIVVITTTNHPPYSVPDSYKPGPLEIPDDLRKAITNDISLAYKRFVTYQYANEQLGGFITKIKNSSLGGRTIIAATGDHNFWDVFNYSPEETFLRYSVPFYLYVPQALKPAKVDTSVFGSHMDIMPTLYALSFSGAEYFAAGKNMLAGNAAALNGEGIVVTKDGAVYRPYADTATRYFRWNTSAPGMLKTGAPSTAQKNLPAYYQSAVTVADYVIKNAGKTTFQSH